MNKFVWCALDVDKEASLLFDQQVRDTCVQHLELAANASKRETSLAANASAQQRYSEEEQRRPFFIGCGFHKPHAPYYAPKEFYDRLPPHQLIPLPLDPFAPVGMPAVAWHPYADSHGMTENPGEAWQWIWQCLLYCKRLGAVLLYLLHDGISPSLHTSPLSRSTRQRSTAP